MNFVQVLIPRSLNCQMNFLYFSDTVHWRSQMISDPVFSASEYFLTYRGILFHCSALRMLKVCLVL